MAPPWKKANVIDMFGPWVQYDELKLETAACASVPSVKVQRADVLLMNVELDGDSKIPFQVFDVLRMEWNIDVTAISFVATSIEPMCCRRFESDVIVDWENGKQNQAVDDRSCYAM